MILHAKNGQLFVAHSLDRTVVEILMRHFHFLRQGIGIDREAVIL